MLSSSFVSRIFLVGLPLLASIATAQPTSTDNANAQAGAVPSAAIVGVTLFTTTYVASVLAASDSYRQGDDTVPSHPELYIPVAGPLLSLDGRSRGMDAVLVFDAAAQTAGLACLAVGLLHRHGAANDRATHVVPLLGAATGVALNGRF